MKNQATETPPQRVRDQFRLGWAKQEVFRQCELIGRMNNPSTFHMEQLRDRKEIIDWLLYEIAMLNEKEQKAEAQCTESTSDADT